MSHPVVSGKKQFTAFRGSLRIETSEGYREVHVGLRSGESLPLSDLRFLAGETKQVRLSLVYPADATPGHLLSVVPIQQLAMLNRQRQQQAKAKSKVETEKGRRVSPKVAPPSPTKATVQPVLITVPKPVPAVLPLRYQGAIQSQQQWLDQFQP